MPSKTGKLASRTIIYLMLIVGCVAAIFPFLWLISTALKPAEQTMTLPPMWIPRAYYATLDGKRVEVTRDFQVAQTSVLIVPEEGTEAGRTNLVPAELYDSEKNLARVQVFSGGIKEERFVPSKLIRTVPAGHWKVTESSPTKIRTKTLAWDVLPPSEIEVKFKPRWENFPVAMATMGGRSIDEVEGTVTRQTTGLGIDSDVTFSTFLFNTLLVCTLGVIGAVLSNAIIAYGFARVRWKGRNALFALTLATMMVPFPVLMVPLYSLFKNLGWIGTLYPLWVPAFFGSAFNIFLMRQFFRTIPQELSDAARIDGCSEWQIFWKIILPLSKPVIAVVALFHFLNAWNDFMGPLLFLTRKHTFTLALALQSYQTQHGGVQWHHLMAASTVVVLPIIILFFFAQKTFIKGIATTGLKG